MPWKEADKKQMSPGTETTLPRGTAHPLWYHAKLERKYAVPNCALPLHVCFSLWRRCLSGWHHQSHSPETWALCTISRRPRALPALLGILPQCLEQRPAPRNSQQVLAEFSILPSLSPYIQSVPKPCQFYLLNNFLSQLWNLKWFIVQFASNKQSFMIHWISTNTLESLIPSMLSANTGGAVGAWGGCLLPQGLLGLCHMTRWDTNTSPQVSCEVIVIRLTHPL